MNADSFIVHRPHASTTAKASFMADIKRGHKQQETLTIDEGKNSQRMQSRVTLLYCAPTASHPQKLETSTALQTRIQCYNLRRSCSLC